MNEWESYEEWLDSEKQKDRASLKDYDERLKLDGREFVTTIFDPMDEESMILILGDNINGEQEGLTFLFLYFASRGEVEHGIESLAFNSPEEAWVFVKNLPTMSAVEFMFKTLGVKPGY